MTVKKRMIEFLSYIGKGQLDFEQTVGLSRGFVNKIGDSIRVKSMDKIKSVYPELNTTWLLTGQGTMLKGVEYEYKNEVSNAADGAVPYSKQGKSTEANALPIAELVKALSDISESVKLNALANERNSRNMEKMLDMINEERASEKGVGYVKRIDKSDAAQTA